MTLEAPERRPSVIDPMKLHGYILSRSHPVGRFKATFFSALGYTPEGWQQLEADLRSQHLAHDAVAGMASRYGQTYEIRATLVGPSGRSAGVVSIWFVPVGKDVPRFVTAYPEGRR
jgi:hypothetical protein